MPRAIGLFLIGVAVLVAVLWPGTRATVDLGSLESMTELTARAHLLLAVVLGLEFLGCFLVHAEVRARRRPRTARLASGAAACLILPVLGQGLATAGTREPPSELLRALGTGVTIVAVFPLAVSGLLLMAAAWRSRALPRPLPLLLLPLPLPALAAAVDVGETARTVALVVAVAWLGLGLGAGVHAVSARNAGVPTTEPAGNPPRQG